MSKNVQEKKVFWLLEPLHSRGCLFNKIRFTGNEFTFLVADVLTEAYLRSYKVVFYVSQITPKKFYDCSGVDLVVRVLATDEHSHAIVVIEFYEHQSCALHSVAPIV